MAFIPTTVVSATIVPRSWVHVYSSLPSFCSSAVAFDSVAESWLQWHLPQCGCGCEFGFGINYLAFPWCPLYHELHGLLFVGLAPTPTPIHLDNMSSHSPGRNLLLQGLNGDSAPSVDANTTTSTTTNNHNSNADPQTTAAATTTKVARTSNYASIVRSGTGIGSLLGSSDDRGHNSGFGSGFGSGSGSGNGTRSASISRAASGISMPSGGIVLSRNVSANGYYYGYTTTTVSSSSCSSTESYVT